jgi:hypothetical protein
MKKMLISMMAALWMSSAIAANTTSMQPDEQQGGPRRHALTPEKVTERMTEELDLSKKQVEKVQKLNEEYADIFQRPGRHHRHHGMYRGMKGKDCCKAGKECCKADKDCCKAEKGCNKEQKDCGKDKADCKKDAHQGVDGQTGASQVEQKQGRSKRPELTEEQKAERKARFEQHKARKAEYDAKLKDILSKKQFEKYQAQRKHRGPRHHGGFHRD